jgi:carnitine O-acetyltransferase
MALGAPPPPAGVPLELPADEVDAVAGLFASDKTVPAPGINDAPSEAEIGRWVATAKTSLFDDNVKDPAPAGASPPPAGRSSEPQQRKSAPKLPAVAPDDEDVGLAATQFATMSEPNAMPSRKPRAPAPPPPASPLPVQSKRSGSGARKKTAPAKPKAAEPDEQEQDSSLDEEPQLKPRRRFERGPSKTLLIAVGIGAMLSLGAALVLIGAVPNPLASEPPARAAAPGRRAQTPAKAAVAKAAPAATKAAPSTAAMKAAPAPSAAKTAPSAAAPAQSLAALKGGPAKIAAAPAVVAAAPVKPVTAVPAAAKPAPIEPEPAPARASEDSESEEGGSGSGKLAQARKLLAADNPQAAEALARQVLAGDPSDHHAMDVLAHALMDQDRGKEALPYARKMVQKRSKRVPYRLLLGDLLLMVGDEAGARAEWQNALLLDPGNREIKRRLAK